jgi:hypothetical protein
LHVLQLPHVVVPINVVNVPAWHAMHVEELVMFVYLPGLHELQVDDAVTLM